MILFDYDAVSRTSLLDSASVEIGQYNTTRSVENSAHGSLGPVT